ncbi:MAG: transposase [Rhizobiales bacterium]|nr:transposase [Hyphomicrobiales bacterium]
MDGEVLGDDRWERMKPFVPGGRKASMARAATAGASSMLCFGWLARARWRDLPAGRFGSYQTAKRRYYRWIELGVFDRLFETVALPPDLEWLAIDATVIRPQAQAAGARRKRGTSSPGSRPLAWRLRHQTACRRRRTRPAGPLRNRTGPAERHAARMPPPQGSHPAR